MVWALTRTPAPQVLDRLARLVRDTVIDPPLALELRSMFARSEHAAAHDALALLARSGAPPAGWLHLCKEHDAEEAADPPWPSYGGGEILGAAGSPCGGLWGQGGDSRVVWYAGEFWLRRRSGGHWMAPQRIPGARVGRGALRVVDAGDHLVVTGKDGAVLRVEPGRVLADGDVDGLGDGTEAFLGTDPDRRDTDGDGEADGLDPSPTAGRRPDDLDLARRTALAHVASTWSKGRAILVVCQPRASAFHLSGAAAVVLQRQWTPPVSLDEIRTCDHPGALAVGVRSLEVRSDRATVVIERAHDRDGAQEELTLRRVRGEWHVTRTAILQSWSAPLEMDDRSR